MALRVARPGYAQRLTTLSTDAWLRLVLAVLATWRITHLLALEDGPWDVIARIRMRLGNGFWGRLLDCFYCVSLWVAAPIAAFVRPPLIEWPLWWLACSGGACLLERLNTQPVHLNPSQRLDQTELIASEQREGDRDHELLRTTPDERVSNSHARERGAGPS